MHPQDINDLKRMTGNVWYVVLVCLIRLPALPACAATSRTPSDSLAELLNRACQANVQHRIEDEERLLRQALKKDGSPREQAEQLTLVVVL